MALPLGPLRASGTLSSGRPNRQVRRWHDEVVTERAALQGGSQRGRFLACRLGRSLDGAPTGAQRPPLITPFFLRAALSVIACSDDTSPKGGGETWLSLWESWQRIALTERVTFKGGSQRGRFLTCRLGRSLDAPHRGAATPFGIRLYKTVPLPRRRGYRYLLGMGAGGGKGGGLA